MPFIEAPAAWRSGRSLHHGAVAIAEDSLSFTPIGSTEPSDKFSLSTVQEVIVNDWTESMLTGNCPHMSIMAEPPSLTVTLSKKKPITFYVCNVSTFLRFSLWFQRLGLMAPAERWNNAQSTSFAVFSFQQDRPSSRSGHCVRVSYGIGADEL